MGSLRVAASCFGYPALGCVRYFSARADSGTYDMRESLTPCQRLSFPTAVELSNGRALSHSPTKRKVLKRELSTTNEPKVHYKPLGILRIRT